MGDWRHYSTWMALAKNTTPGSNAPKPVTENKCGYCRFNWPCDAEQMRLERDAERARTVVLTEALDQLEHDVEIVIVGLSAPLPEPRTMHATWVGYLQTALDVARGSVLPLDRVGVEPLDVAATDG